MEIPNIENLTGESVPSLQVEATPVVDPIQALLKPETAEEEMGEAEEPEEEELEELAEEGELSEEEEPQEEQEPQVCISHCPWVLITACCWVSDRVFIGIVIFCLSGVHGQ